MTSETPKNYIQSVLKTALEALKLDTLIEKVDLSVPDVNFGHYSTNVALVLAKKAKQNPKELAAKIVKKIEKIDAGQHIEKVEEKSGFINFVLTREFVAQQILRATDLNSVSIVADGSVPKKVLFEYSSPNTNKPLHIGHTRNDVYGMACIRLLRAVGYEVIASEVINDRGIHIMKSVLMYMLHGKNKTPESEGVKPDHFVGKFYTMFAKKAAESPEVEQELLEQAQQLLQQWEAGDGAVHEVWKQMNEWEFVGMQQTYAKEGSVFDEVNYESEIYNKGREIVLEGVKHGVFTQEEDGSVSVDLTAEGLDKKYLLRKDGTTIYITQDLYLWYLRNKKHHPDIAIVTTAAEQSYHFAVLKKLFELLQFPWAQNFFHLPYEHVFLGHDKMSSRGGNTVSADELLDLIKSKVRLVMSGLEKTKQETSNDVLIEQVAFAAIKYGYLKYEPNTRIFFDTDQTIALDGNTGPYIQYAYSRIQSILQKAGSFTQMSPKDISEPEEILLMRQLLYYAETVALAAKEYKPNLLCNYLYELASQFSRFYNAVSVVNTENEILKKQRLTLLDATGQVLSDGLALLGITAPPSM